MPKRLTQRTYRKPRYTSKGFREWQRQNISMADLFAYTMFCAPNRRGFAARFLGKPEIKREPTKEQIRIETLMKVKYDRRIHYTVDWQPVK